MHGIKKMLLYLTDGSKFFSELSEKCLEFMICLPGSTASVEGIISIMNSIWTKEKSRLSIETLRAMLIVRLG
jgi:hypothetical protein